MTAVYFCQLGLSYLRASERATHRELLQLEVLQELRVIILAISDDVSDTIVELILPSRAILQSSDDPLSTTRMCIAVWKEVWNISIW